MKKQRLLLAFGGTWFALVAGVYALLLPKLPALNVRTALAGIDRFFLWQVLGFLLLLGLAVLRPRFGSVAAVLYLGVSTILLLASARSLSLVLGFLAFAAWAWFAVQTTRVLLTKLAGPLLATWGIAATFLFAILIPLAFGLGVLHLVRLRFVLPLAVVMVIPGLLTLPRSLRAWVRRSRRLAALGAFGVIGLEVAWLVLAIALVWASVPESGSDSIRVYLPYARDVATTHGFEVQRIDWHRLMPMAMPAVWADAFKLGGAQAAKWLSWAALVALTVLVWEEMASRARSRGFASLATAAVVSCPVLATLARTLYVDHVVVLLAVGSFVSLVRSLARRSRRGVVVSAVMTAALSQVKYTGAILVVAWVAVVIVVTWRRSGLRRGLSWCAPAIMVLGIASLPWYAYTFATTGDPVFPFLRRWFSSPFWPNSAPDAFGQAQFQGPGSVLGWLRFPWTATFHTSTTSLASDGSLGFWLLALVPLAFGARGGRRRSAWPFAAGGAALFVSLAPASVNARYLLPSYVLLLIWLLALGATSVRRSPARPPRWAMAVLAPVTALAMGLPLAIWVCAQHGPYRFPWDVYAGTTSQESYLKELVPGFSGFEALNTYLRPEDKVLVLGDVGVDLVHARAYEFPFWHTMVAGIKDPTAMTRFLAANDIKYWLVDHSQIDDAVYFGALGVPLRYWRPTSLVAAEGTIAAYRLDHGAATRTMACVKEERIKPLLGGASGWSGPASGGGGLRVLRPLIAERRSLLGRTLHVPPGAEMCRVVVRVGGAPGSAVFVQLKWLAADGRELDSAAGTDVLPGGLGLVRATLFSPVPQGSVAARLMLWSSQELTVGVGSVSYWCRIGSPAGPSNSPRVRPQIAQLSPSEIVVGEGYNVQPGGLSALAVLGQFAADHKNLIVVDGTVLPGSDSTADLVTALVPSDLLTTPGEYGVFIVDATAGVHSNSLTLHVRQGRVSPPIDAWRRAIRIGSLFPRDASAGARFNVQPDGSNSLAVKGQLAADRQYEVVIDGEIVQGVMAGPGVVSVAFPREQAQLPGEHEVFVVDPVAMERSNSLFFALRPEAAPAPSR